MQAEKDHRIRDLGLMILALRPDLRFMPRTAGGEPCYLVEDAVNSKYYTIGIPEYTFISCLDGRTSVAKALSLTARAVPQDALTEDDAATICRWLIDAELAFTAESTDSQRLAQAANKRAGFQWTQWNPLFMKLPLCFPDRVLDRMLPWTGWLYSGTTGAVTFALVLVAAYRVFAQWDRFAAASVGVFTPSRWIWLGLCWLALKIVHEISHGAVCKKYGGSVHEAGVILILFAPLAYVDVTSSWRFKSKWQRIHTAAAGMHIEILIASLAALGWAATAPGFVNDLCFHLVLMAGATTLLFNANPLMRFDGYYILADLLDVPNLYADGQLFLRYLARRYVLGVPAELSSGSPARDLFIRLYGVAAFCWRTTVSFCLILAAATLFHGAGLVVALLATVMWLVVPAVKLAVYLFRGDGWENPNRLRFACVVVPALVCAFLFVNKVPWPGVTLAPAIVEYAPLAVVRAGSPGFVRQIEVQSGQFVEQGQLIAILENQELELELRDLAAAIEQTILKGRVFKQREQMAAYQAEQKELESLRKQYAEKRAEVEQLTVRAPLSGRVIARDPRALLGTYASPGSEIVSLGNEHQKELRLAIEQEDVDEFSSHIGRWIDIRIHGKPRLKCKLSRVPPRAGIVPPHVSLCAPYGGLLEVRPKRNREPDLPEDQFELLKPRFTGVVSLTGQESARLRVGQRGVAWLPRGQGSTIAAHLLAILRDAVPETLARQFNVRP